MKKSLRNTSTTINGTKIIGLRWYSSLGAYLGTVLESGWLGGSTHPVVTTWNRDGKQLGFYGTARAGYNLQ